MSQSFSDPFSRQVKTHNYSSLRIGFVLFPLVLVTCTRKAGGCPEGHHGSGKLGREIQGELEHTIEFPYQNPAVWPPLLSISLVVLFLIRFQSSKKKWILMGFAILFIAFVEKWSFRVPVLPVLVYSNLPTLFIIASTLTLL